MFLWTINNSKYNIQFDKEAIRYTLTNAGFVYIYMGKELAAKRIRKNSYNYEGYSNFEEVLKEAQEKGYAERNPEADVEG